MPSARPRHGPRIVHMQVFGRLRGRRHHLDPVLGGEPVPAALRHHQKRAGAESVRLDLVFDDDVETGRALVGDGAKVRLFAEVRWAISHQM